MPTLIKYGLPAATVLLLAWFSVNIKKLDTVRAAKTAAHFDATVYAGNFWQHTLLPGLDKAVALDSLLGLLRTQKEAAFNHYSHALGIGNIRYFLVKGAGAITAIHPDDVSLELLNDTAHTQAAIETEYIFGNAVRDASGLIDINDFKNTVDFNNVSVALNTIIRNQVLPAFTANVKKGDTVRYAGAIELNSEHLKTDNIKIIPVQLTLLR
jgi:predicted lipoprotein